ncbi:MAG: 3-deoxy-D-manno-octulosonic acid transferase [Proteobacteria bacterium]|nr:MAG: 3-deoxy-D-manno-octulosonic acid transferase [Pseudomonadota bacterium]PIE67060.1 MAG: 3-deoxy-D-manno-octulosonic acid transferase [Deltaproteobacteria bacterium]
MHFLYNLVFLVALVLLGPVWIPVVCLRRKYRSTMAHRLAMAGIPGKAADRGDTSGHRRIWVHALSVGEVMSAEPLVAALSKKYGAENLVFTASTRTGFQTAQRLMNAHVLAVRHFPFDLLFSVNRAIDVIRPRQVIIVETDIWPNVLLQLRRKRIPVYLVNARLSDRSWRGYMRMRPLMARLLAVFARICVQTDMDRSRFLEVGAPPSRLTTTGNIKFDQPLVRLSIDQRFHLQAWLNLPLDIPIWVAGSTHEGEEIVLADAFKQLQKSGRASALVVAPRDPERAAEVSRLFRRVGIDAVLLERASHRPSPNQVVIIDRIGLLRDLYAIADLTFVGGSLVDSGGHNPLEPASVARPILAGPDTGNFRWIYRTLEETGGLMRVCDAQSLATGLISLLDDPDRRVHMGQCAHDVFRRHRGAVKRTLVAIHDPGAGPYP